MKAGMTPALAIKDVEVQAHAYFDNPERFLAAYVADPVAATNALVDDPHAFGPSRLSGFGPLYKCRYQEQLITAARRLIRLTGTRADVRSTLRRTKKTT